MHLTKKIQVHFCIFQLQNNHQTETAVFDIEKFKSFLQGIDGGSKSYEIAKAITNDIIYFFNSIPCSSTSIPMANDMLLNLENLENFFQSIKKERSYKPTTQQEKLRRLKMAIQFVMREQDSEMTNESLYIRSSQIIKRPNKCIKSLSKAVGKQRQEHGLSISSKISSKQFTLPELLTN